MRGRWALAAIAVLATSGFVGGDEERDAPPPLAAPSPPDGGRGWIDGGDIDAILELAREFGPARRGADDDGRPTIEGTIDGIAYGVAFSRCEPECALMRFVAGFDVEPGFAHSEANRLNDRQRFAFVELDEDWDPWLEMEVWLEHGVTIENMRDTIDWWAVNLDWFSLYLEER